MRLLAIDIGASSGKAVLGDFSGSTLKTKEVRRFSNGFIEVNGHKHWDILRLFEEVKECLRAAPEADCVGVDAWGVDYGYVGRDGDLLGLPFAYRDSRIEKSIPIVHSKVPFEELYRLTGIQFLPFNTIYQVAEDLESRPWLIENAGKLLMIPELLGWMLTGESVGEYTNASTSALLDVHKREWAADILERIGFPPDRLPRLIMPGTLRLPMTKRIAEETGCRAQFAFVACHDTASAVAGIPADGENWAFISSGTWSLVGMELPEPITTDAARDANFTNEGGMDGKIRFLTNVTGLWLLDELRRAWERNDEDVDFETILRQAEKAPPFRSLVDPDDPSFAAPPDMRVAIREFCLQTGQTVPNGIGPFSRCVFESLALAYRRKIEKVQEITGRKIDRINVVGGGSRNRLLCQLTADACGVPVIAGPAEASAIGNLLMQGVICGLVRSVPEGRRMVRASCELTTYVPTKHEMWKGPAEGFQRERK